MTMTEQDHDKSGLSEEDNIESPRGFATTARSIS